MSGDESSRRDRRTGREEREIERANRHTERDDRPGRSTPAGGDAGPRAGREETSGSGEEATDDGEGPLAGVDIDETFEGLPVSAGVVGNAAAAFVTWVVLGFALAFTAIILLTLFGGSFRVGEPVVGFPAVAFVTLVGPVLGVPMGLWARDEADGDLLAIPGTFLANAIGHFSMALIAAVAIAVGLRGLQLVDLVIPFFFAAFFTGFVAAVTAGLGSLLTRLRS